MSSDTPKPVFRQVLAQARRWPDKPAIVVPNGRNITYGELASSVASAAAALRDRYGVGTGDRVILLADSHADFVCAYLAAHSIGAIAVPLDPHTAAARFADIVNRVSPRLIVAEKRMPAAGQTCLSFEDLAAAGGADAVQQPAEVDAGDIADILFTTGTTGRSKGVALSHRALAVACAHINAFIGTRGDAVEVLPLPLSHSFGLGRVRCVLSVGATLVLVGGFVGSAKILSALGKYRATGFASVPTGFAILLSDRGAALGRYASQLEYIEIGSSAMPLEQKRLLITLLPKTRICMHYGLTEASRSAYLSFHDDKDRLDSIGRPSSGVELRVVDDAGRPVRDGAEGNIEIRGGHLMSGYWQDPELTAQTVHDGWLRSGDLGSRDADGFYYLKARASDLINVGGRKVSPQEIEAILESHAGVAECACVGVPDPQGFSGEMVSAFLVADPAYGERPKFSELAALLRRSLESYKVPRTFTWIDALPKSSSGKLLRRKLRDR